VIAESHHEWWDGSGYPKGLVGTDIPLVGRIVAVADVFDALTHDRPYKPAWPVEQALAMVRRSAGSQFDPDVVSAFLRVAARVRDRTATPGAAAARPAQPGRARRQHQRRDIAAAGPDPRSPGDASLASGG
jgi:HD-GYP domain-containing protein (c-di-GMP phosphodiesterase class II)